MNVLLSVIDPVAISIGPIKIYWYGIIIALAMLIGISLATKEAQKLGLEEDTIMGHTNWLYRCPTLLRFIQMGLLYTESE